MTFPQFIRIGLFTGTTLLAAAVFVFTQQVVGRLSTEVASTSRVLAQFCAQASFPAVRNEEMREILTEVISNIDFPLVITDNVGMPRAWRRIDVPPDLVPAESIDSLAAGMTIAPVIRERIDLVRARAGAMDRKYPPIAMARPGTAASLGLVHYGDPDVLTRLRWLPFFSVGGVLLLVALGLWGLAIIRQAEKRSIWVGMAKETAHQLGTPLSSLMGWVHLLRVHIEGKDRDGDVHIPATEVAETVDEMERDIERLNKVAQRFGRVGSAPDLSSRDVTPVVRDVVAYMSRRIPRGDLAVEIREDYRPVPQARINTELLEWALENLISNALTALDKQPRVIEVGVAPVDGGVEVTVKDNGRGMTRAEQRRAFEPGYTTRKRGWGLGLPLARRVVQENHGGKLYVKSSTPGQGTTMAIRLPS